MSALFIGGGSHVSGFEGDINIRVLPLCFGRCGGSCFLVRGGRGCAEALRVKFVCFGLSLSHVMLASERIVWVIIGPGFGSGFNCAKPAVLAGGLEWGHRRFDCVGFWTYAVVISV